jgi:PAS domain S-box-containing protein
MGNNYLYKVFHDIFQTNRTARKLTITVIFFSSLITLIATAIQITMDYRRDIRQINNGLQLIESGYLESLANSVWIYDKEQIKMQLDGLLLFADTEFLSIVLQDGTTKWSVGAAKSERVINTSFFLKRNHRGSEIILGKLQVISSLDSVYNRLLDKVVVILISNAIKTFLVSLFVLLVFNFFVTRRLKKVAKYVEAIDLESPMEQLIITDHSDDELTQISTSINNMQKRLASSFDTLQLREAQLASELLEREKAQLALQESEARFRALVEQAPEAILLFDSEHNCFVDANLHALELFQKSKEDLMQMAPLDLWSKNSVVDPNVQSSFKENLQEVIAGNTVIFQRDYELNNGNIRHLEVRLVKMPYINQKIIRASFIDITQRVAEQKLSKTITNSLVDTFFLFDPQTGKAIEWNKKFNEVTGYSDEEIANNLAPVSYYSESDLKKAADIIEKITTQGVGTVELDIICKNGDRIPFEYSSSIVQSPDGPLVISIGRDVTDRNEIEAQLRQSQKMEAVGTLAGGIAHDFNNILGIIMGNAELASLGIGETPEVMEKIISATKRGRNLVRQLLTFSRTNQLSMQYLNPVDLLKEVVHFLRSAMPSSIEIIEDYQVENVQIYGDPTQMHQLFMNLCTNANQAMGEEGGILNVAMSSSEINEDMASVLAIKSGAYIEIIIQDSGVGMAQDVKERIFEPFFTTKPVEKGTGLGLSVVHGAIQACGGGINVESQLGEGTTFKVYLPVSNDTKNVEGNEDQATVIPSSGEKILFVDDEPGLVDVGVQMLKSIGYEAVGFTDSKKALTEFLKAPTTFAAVVTDQVMPGLAGQELASQILAVRGDMPIFLCTGYCETMTEKKALEKGFKGFFLKPVTLTDLSKALNKAITFKV